MVDSSTKNSQSPSSEASVQNYFLLSEQSAFGAARFSRGSRPGLFSNCPLLSTPVVDKDVGADHNTKPSAQPVEKIHLDVAIRKETLHLIKVPDSKDTYLLDFVFDANADGTLSIFYLAEEISDASNKTLKFETSYPVVSSQLNRATPHPVKLTPSAPGAAQAAPLQKGPCATFPAACGRGLQPLPRAEPRGHAAPKGARAEPSAAPPPSTHTGPGLTRRPGPQGSPHFPLVIVLQTADESPARSVSTPPTPPPLSHH
jgi:hypothetical protein